MQACARDDNRLDAVVYPTQTDRIARIGENARRNAHGRFGNFGPVLASLAGWPEITVPAGATDEGLPAGLSILAPRYEDWKVLDIGYAFEQTTHAIRRPPTTPPLPGERF